MPSIEVTVASGLSSVNPCKACAMHSHPARVLNAYWCGAVAFSTVVAHCCAMVRLTKRRTMSPTTPRTQTSGLDETRGVHPSLLEGLLHVPTAHQPRKATSSLLHHPKEDANVRSSSLMGPPKRVAGWKLTNSGNGSVAQIRVP